MKPLRTALIMAVFLPTLACTAADNDSPIKECSGKVAYFNPDEVRLTGGIFKHAQDLDIAYLKALDPDRLLAPYLKESGLPPKAENYPNWENTGLDGHIGGHYLSALAHMWAATGDEELKHRLDYMVAELQRCQDANGDGYLSGVPDGKRIWNEVKRGDIRAGGFDLNGGWVPLYNIHKIFAGLRDAYLAGGNDDARAMLIKLTDWMAGITAGLTDQQVQDMLVSEHGGLNEVFADVAAITGDSKYLKLADRFSHRAILTPLAQREDKLTGLHANTQIPKVIGFKRIADLQPDSASRCELDGCASFFWNNVTNNRSVSIGGNSVREHFHPTDDFSTMLTSEQGPETCNTYNMLRLTKMLYRTSADTRFIDYYERALLNHILSSQNSRTGGLVYFTPMRGGHYRVYSQPQTSFWCCVGSGMENHARYGEMIYARQGDDTLMVNLFIPSRLEWHTHDSKRIIEQATGFPSEESTTIKITPAGKKEKFTLAVRVPSWVGNDKISLSINGKKVKKANAENGYIAVTRKWQQGDSLTVSLPMHLRAEQLPDKTDNYSFLYGPLVLAADLGHDEQSGLFADDSRGGHIASGKRMPLDKLPAIVENKKTQEHILSHLAPVENAPLEFTLSGLNEEGRQLRLKPFYSLNECRYMVYWPVYTDREWEAKYWEIARNEAAREALEAITADVVICGEQQPESDHFVKLDNTGSWDDDGRHWREARGFMAYTMKHGGKRSLVRITFRPEKGKDFRVLINGSEAGSFGRGEGPEATVAVAVPEEALKKATMEVRLIPDTGEITPHIYEIRVVNR